MSVLRADYGGNTGLPVVADRRVGHVRAQEDDRLVEHLHRERAGVSGGRD